MRGGDFERKHVLGIVADAGRVAMAPFAEYLEAVALLPVTQRVLSCSDPGFFFDLARRRRDQCLSVFRLPVTDCQ